MNTWLDNHPNPTWEQFVAYATANDWHHFTSSDILGKVTKENVKINFIRRMHGHEGVAVVISRNGDEVVIPTSFVQAYRLANAVASATGGWDYEPKLGALELSLVELGEDK